MLHYRLNGEKGLTMENRYVVVDMPTGDGDWFQEVYSTFSDFNGFPGAFSSDPGSNWGRT